MVKALASHRCGSGSNPSVDAIYGWRLLLVLSLALRGLAFFLEAGRATPFSSSPQKSTLQNSIKFDLERTSY